MLVLGEGSWCFILLRVKPWHPEKARFFRHGFFRFQVSILLRIRGTDT